MDEYLQVLTLHWGRLAIVVVATFFIFCVTRTFLSSSESKLQVSFGFIGIFVYSGIGTCYTVTHIELLIVYIVYLLFWAIAFVLASRFVEHNLIIEPRISSAQWNGVFSVEMKIALIVTFVLVFGSMLIGPVTIGRLLNPPAPDSAYDFQRQLGLIENRSMLKAGVAYLEMLLLPFIFLSWHMFRRKPHIALIAIIVYFYCVYCRDEYLGRYKIGAGLIAFAVFAFKSRPDLKKIYFTIFGWSIPLLALLAVQYSKIRIGGAASGFSAEEFAYSFDLIVHQETFYMTLLNEVWAADRPAEIARFFYWIASLPLPEFIIPFGDVMLIGIEFTDFVTGKTIGVDLFSAILPSIVGESVWVFGQDWFFLHAITVGIVFGGLGAVFRARPEFIGLWAFVCADMIVVSRGGVPGSFGRYLAGFQIVWIFMAIHYRLIRQVKCDSLISENSSKQGPQSQ